MQVIIYTTEKGNVAVCVPTGELSIEEVLAKDCPVGSIIIDDSELPTDNEFFDAWVLNNGVVTVDNTKKATMQTAKQKEISAKELALSKLTSLGLTIDDLTALGITS
jgi:hypothetical protein